MLPRFCQLLTLLQRYFVRPLNDVTVKEKETAVFECEVSVAKVPIKWYINGTEVVNSPTHNVSMEKAVHTLRIEKAQKDEAGEVMAKFYKAESRAQLTVTGSSSVDTLHFLSVSQH